MLEERISELEQDKPGLIDGHAYLHVSRVVVDGKRYWFFHDDSACKLVIQPSSNTGSPNNRFLKVTAYGPGNEGPSGMGTVLGKSIAIEYDGPGWGGGE